MRKVAVRIEELENRFTGAMAYFAKEVGIVGAAEGRLLGFLILAGEALSQDNLMEKSGMSRGNVSMALRVLIESGFIRKTRRKGDRREYYEAHADLWRVTLGLVLDRISRQIETAHNEFRELLAEGRNIKKNDRDAGERRNAARLVRQVEKLEGYITGAYKLMDSVRRLVGRSKK